MLKISFPSSQLARGSSSTASVFLVILKPRSEPNYIATMGIMPFGRADNYDVETGAEKHRAPNGANEYIGDEGAVHAETFIVGDSLYARTQRFASGFGVEARGIERVPSDERTDAGMSKIGTLVCNAQSIL
jgi:hypothetical protein